MLKTEAQEAKTMPPVQKSSGDSNAWKRPVAIVALLFALAAGLVLTATLDIPREATAAALIGLTLLLTILNLPVAVAMGVSGLLGLLILGGPQVVAGTMAELPFRNAASSTLSVLPMFILMGLLLWRSGITKQLYVAAQKWFGWLPGGLAITTNIAGAGLGAASGSTIGITYAVGRIGIPEMLKNGYSKTLALGSVVSAGTIGQLIPPSILLVVYAGFAQVPVGPQLVAGIIPGLLLTLAYSTLIVVMALYRRPRTSESSLATTSVSWRERWEATLAIWPLPVIILVVVGGMFSGLFTATEAGAVGALVSALYCAFRLGLRGFWKPALQALRDTVISVGSIMFLLMGAALLNRVLALSGAAQWFANQISGLGLNMLGFVLVLVLFYLLLGMFMDPTAMILLTVPLLLPTAVEMGISPLWFGVFLVLMGEIAIMTPPVGVLVFVVHRLAQDPLVNLGQKISLVDVFKAALYFIPGALLVILVITLFPDLVTWLPDLGAAT